MPASRTDNRNRARVVCTICHERKVRCDLQDQPGGSCRNCQRTGAQCRLHIGSRRRRVGARRSSTGIQTGVAQGPVEPLAASAQALVSPEESLPPSESTNQLQSGYIGDRSVLAYPPTPTPAHPNDGLAPGQADLALSSTKAREPPPRVVAEALVDFFFDELSPLMPVVDRGELECRDAPLLLRQSLCFAGSMVRRSSAAAGHHHAAFSSTRALYIKVKTLLFLETENDPLVVLRAVALLGSWSSHPPQAISLECPWQWNGTAIRLALQLGLHREATYTDSERHKRSRRVMWFLFNNETLQSICYGRPSMLRLQDLDIRHPEPNDFPEGRGDSISAMVFCAMSRLCAELSHIEALSAQRRPASPSAILDRVSALRAWIAALAPALRLFDDDEHPDSRRRRPWSRPVAECHIFYFVAVILVCLLPGPHRQSATFCTASIVASSCIARLYEEILCHEEVHCLLPIHGWTALVAAVPQMYCGVKHPHLASVCAEELDITAALLAQMRAKYESAAVVLAKVDALRRTDAAAALMCLNHPLPSSSSSSSSSPPLRVNGISSSNQTGDGQPWRETEELAGAIAGLFPFPSHLSPKMGLLPLPPFGSSAVDVDTTTATMAAELPSPVAMPFDPSEITWPLDLSAFSLANLDSLFPSDVEASSGDAGSSGVDRVLHTAII